jgi:arylsulfatase A-like enzyme
MSRATLRLLVMLCLTAWSCGPAEPPAAPPPPAFRGTVLILVDTLRADHVGVYGSTQSLTPRIDQFAESSLVFRKMVAASSWTRASVASMFTGQYPTTIDVLTKQDALSDDLETVAETLRGQDVATLGVSTNGNAGASFGFDQGFDEWVTDLPKVGYPGDFKVVAADQVTRQGLEFVDQLEPAEQFFLFLHYIDPHDPYLPHPEQQRGEPPPGRFDGSRADLNTLTRMARAERTTADKQRIRHLYEGEIAYNDFWLGELFDGLEERGLMDQLLVVYTSDHGEGLWDHGLRAHGTDLYEEQIMVPLIVRFPPSEQVQARHVHSFASHVDIAPTILGAFGMDLPEAYQGRDLGAAARLGTLEQSHSFGYSEMNFTGIDLESVNDGVEKLIRNRAFDGNRADAYEYTVRPGDTVSILSRSRYGRNNHVNEIIKANQAHIPLGTPFEQIKLVPGTVLQMPARHRKAGDDLYQLFDLKADPWEQEDLSDAGEGARSRLHATLRHVGNENLARSIEGAHISLDELDEETLNALRGLGYLGDLGGPGEPSREADGR